ncbi:hypothetical protein [Bradyrhizobium sp. CCGB01]|uniref:hypothetical protein n=1 Tax=Bradyrhizobium sp. CCGB01 TaxID=2949634 RepID=UPI0020B1A49C|nr:hypothetical protein [Bradyrhizobium sp. CCGB01]MCP3409734.1 hypothetical protein [Bradyrhizobium sp. CCGB01]
MSDISPEVLSKLTELIKAAGGVATPRVDGPTWLELLKGFTEFLNAIAWPAAVVLCVFLFRQQVTKFLGDVETVKVFGAEVSRKIDKQIEQSAKEAQAKSETELRSGPSKADLERAKTVKELAANATSAVVISQAESLSAEYERVRASMPSGGDRTRAMEVVVSKMRTIGQAFFPFRHEFAGSASPGRRLMVITTLQVFFDFEMLDWLVQRVGSEKPFLQYQALVAILLGIQGKNAKAYVPSLEAAVSELGRFKASFGSDTSRTGTLEDIESLLGELKQATQKRG